MKKHIYRLIKVLLFGVLTILLSFAISIGLIHHSAKLGNPKAQATLGYMYFFGTGVEQNKVHSLKWFAKATASAVRCGIENAVDTSKDMVKKVTTQASRIFEVFTLTPWRAPKKESAPHS